MLWYIYDIIHKQIKPTNPQPPGSIRLEDDGRVVEFQGAGTAQSHRHRCTVQPPGLDSNRRLAGCGERN